MKKTSLFKIGCLVFPVILTATVVYFLFYYETGGHKFIREREAKERIIGDPIKQLAVKVNEYYDLKFPAKIQDKPKLKPKFAIVHNYSITVDYSTITANPKFDGFHYVYGNLIELIEKDPMLFSKEPSIFGFSESELAQNADEITTTIKVECGNGRYLGRSKREIRNKSGRITDTSSTAGYTAICKVSVFDMAEKSLIAEKTFSNDTDDEANKAESPANTKNESWKVPKQLNEYIADYLNELKKN